MRGSLVLLHSALFFMSGNFIIKRGGKFYMCLISMISDGSFIIIRVGDVYI